MPQLCVGAPGKLRLVSFWIIQQLLLELALQQTEIWEPARMYTLISFPRSYDSTHQALMASNPKRGSKLRSRGNPCLFQCSRHSPPRQSGSCPRSASPPNLQLPAAVSTAKDIVPKRTTTSILLCSNRWLGSRLHSSNSGVGTCDAEVQALRPKLKSSCQRHVRVGWVEIAPGIVVPKPGERTAGGGCSRSQQLMRRPKGPEQLRVSF